LDWSAHPAWFALLFVAIPFWNSVHFYAVHRLLHWMPLYRVAHALHHRNVNVGPWSGISMHPIEHVIYFSSILIHLVIPSHPMHVLFHMQFLTLGAVTSHTGFADLLFKGRTVLKLGAFHHQLHHRYFNCNYGNEYVPCDRWFGSNHDGTPEAAARIRERTKSLGS
jgi:sterol desaturase/sphingolipid hydroxylase (fatty acid hydroxylase superfamily)